MKNILLLLTTMITCGCALGQKYVPKISAGTEISYVISMNGESIPFQLSVNSIGDSLKMTWEVSKYGTGTYMMSAKSLENGQKMVLQAPQPDEITQIPGSETMAFISRSAFRSIAKTQAMEFDDLKYVLTANSTAAITIDNKELDVLHAVSTDGKNEIWVLNNPDFPLICKTTNGSLGAEMTLKHIR